MFSSLFSSSENADSVAQRKLGSIAAVVRKPFYDISVNSKSPEASKLLKQKQPMKQEPAKPVEKPKSPIETDLSAEDFIFSYEEPKDFYDDIWGNPPSLGTEGIIKILRNYCTRSEDTPPPSPVKNLLDIQEIQQTYFDLPIFNYEPEEMEEMSELELDDMDVPPVDFDMSC